MPYIPTSNRKKWQPARKSYQDIRQNNASFYQSTAWRKYRRIYLALHPLCRMCEAEGTITQALMVDHIVTMNKGGDPWEDDNLQPLCNKCHAKKSSKDGRHEQPKQ